MSTTIAIDVKELMNVRMSVFPHLVVLLLFVALLNDFIALLGFLCISGRQKWPSAFGVASNLALPGSIFSVSDEVRSGGFRKKPRLYSVVPIASCATAL